MAKAGGTIRIKAKMQGLDELRAQLLARAESIRSVAVRAAQAGAGVIRAAADAGAPSPGSVDTRTVVLSRKGQVRVDIGSDKKHWYHRFFELGADPHEIKPKLAKRLRFEVGDTVVFARAVQHPGMAARPFLRPAMDERQGQAVAAVGDVLRGAVENG
jgi:HK97 gp10 family phage protein